MGSILIMNNCEIQSNRDLKSKYEEEYLKLDPAILELKLAKPALRALINAGLYQKQQVISFSKSELAQLHGMGPSAIKKLLQLK